MTWNKMALVVLAILHTKLLSLRIKILIEILQREEEEEEAKTAFRFGFKKTKI